MRSILSKRRAGGVSLEQVSGWQKATIGGRLPVPQGGEVTTATAYAVFAHCLPAHVLLRLMVELTV